MVTSLADTLLVKKVRGKCYIIVTRNLYVCLFACLIDRANLKNYQSDLFIEEGLYDITLKTQRRGTVNINVNLSKIFTGEAGTES